MPRQIGFLAQCRIFAFLTLGAVAANSSAVRANDDGAAKVTSTGHYEAPALEQIQRAEYGVSAGEFKAYSPIHTPPHEPLTLVYLLAGVTIAAAAGTLFAGWTLAKTRDEQGNPTRAMTLGTKLSLSMGGLATTLSIMGTLAVRAQLDVTNAGVVVAEMASDADAIADFERDLTRQRMAIRSFFGTNSEADLAVYSDAAAATENKVDTLERVITNPERAKIIHDLQTLIDDYDATFASMVPIIDERNGIVNSQMNKAAPRVEELLKSVLHHASADSNKFVTDSAADAEAAFADARVEFFKFLRFHDKSQAQASLDHLSMAKQLVTAIIEQWKGEPSAEIREAAQAIAFYTDCVQRCLELQTKRTDLEDNRLDKVGPEMVAQASSLVESLTKVQIEAMADAEAAVQQSKLTIGVLVSISLFASCLLAAIIVRSITRASASVVRNLSAIAQRDLTVQPIQSTDGDELGQMARASDSVLIALRGMMEEVLGTSAQVAAASTQIAASSEEMARGMEQQSGQVQQISSAILEMTASVQEVAQKSVDAAGRAQHSGQSATEGEQVVEQTIVGMRSINEAVSASSGSVAELGKRGEQIGQIIKVINDIADQTNLLALNAAIEAARAGEHGRGFAVVADEVRKLAERTQHATKEVGDSILAIQQETRVAVDRMDVGAKQVVQGVEKAHLAGQSLRTIVASAQDVASMIRSIAASAEQQGSASEQVSRSIEAIASVTREATSGASQAAQAAGELSAKAEQLRTLVGTFKMNEGSETRAASRSTPSSSKRHAHAA